MSKIFDWIKSHPWEAGGLVFIAGIIILYFLNSGGSSANAGTGEDPNVAAYLNAEATQDAAGDELQAIQIQTQGATRQAGINAAANVDINNTWAAANIAEGDQTTQQGLIAQLGKLANNLGTVLTNTTSSSGSYGSGGSSSFLWGLFGSSSSSQSSNQSSSSTQTLVANSEQGEATSLLGQIEQSEFHAGN